MATDHSAIEPANLIEFKDVWKSYPVENTEKVVLKEINFSIEDTPDKGEFLVFLGPSGCGKSTILKMIAGLTFPSRGEVTVKGKKVTKPGEVSMVFQSYSSYPWLTVLDNVAFGLKLKGVKRAEREDLAREFIRQVGLEGTESLYPKDLSGGMKQRVAIARSLITNPRFLLMDEPFGALDVKTRMEMQDLLRRIWHDIQCTIIMVTHDISEAVYLGDDIHILSVNPASIAYTMNVPLPIERNHATKKTTQFRNLVGEVTSELEKNIEDRDVSVII